MAEVQLSTLGGVIKQAYESQANTNAFTDSEQTKLQGIEQGAQVNVQADWGASSGSSQILNKPSTLAGLGVTDIFTKDEVNVLLGGKENSLPLPDVDGKVLTSSTTGAKSWVVLPTGGSVTYTTPSPVPTTLGGIVAGKEYLNADISTVLTDLLFPYQTPAFTAFSSNMPATLEVGDTVSAGVKNFTWSTSNAANINLNSIYIKQASSIIGSGLVNDGAESLSVTSMMNTTASSVSFSIEATNTQSNVFTRSVSISWRNAMFYGESDLTSLTEVEVKALRVKTLVTTSVGNYAMLGTGGGYKWICYPTVFGLKTTFKDVGTGLNVAMSPAETVSVTNAFGVTQNYYCHRTFNTTGGNITIGVS